MNIIEAAKSGKKASRYSADSGGITLFIGAGNFQMELTREDILATDWVIEEETVTITRSDLDKAAYKAATIYIGDRGIFPYYDSTYKEYSKLIAKELGFKE